MQVVYLKFCRSVTRIVQVLTLSETQHTVYQQSLQARKQEVTVDPA